MFFVVLDVIAIVYAGFVIYRGRLVELEMNPGAKWLIPVIFFSFGIFQFVTSYFLIENYLTLLIFALSSMIIYISPSGLSTKGAIIIGRLYPFEKIMDYKIKSEHDQLYLEMQVKRRACFLIAKREDKKKVEEYMKKYWR